MDESRLCRTEVVCELCGFRRWFEGRAASVKEAAQVGLEALGEAGWERRSPGEPRWVCPACVDNPPVRHVIAGLSGLEQALSRIAAAMEGVAEDLGNYLSFHS